LYIAKIFFVSGFVHKLFLEFFKDFAKVGEIVQVFSTK
jgi:hypothetical protein